MTKVLPERTIERLSEYRRTLMELSAGALTHIYSHQLAEMHSITAVQVRRDLMLIGFSSDTKRGYDITTLTRHISNIIDAQSPQKVAIIGMGNLAQAITHYFHGKRSKLVIAAAFDNNTDKIGTTISGVPCYDITQFEAIAKKNNIKIVILACPASAAGSMTPHIEQAGIRGVLNFTGSPLNLHRGIFVERYDIITLLEKVAYFSK